MPNQLFLVRISLCALMHILKYFMEYNFYVFTDASSITCLVKHKVDGFCIK